MQRRFEPVKHIMRLDAWIFINCINTLPAIVISRRIQAVCLQQLSSAGPAIRACGLFQLQTTASLNPTFSLDDPFHHAYQLGT
jgi:hypothetical protein